VLRNRGGYSIAFKGRLVVLGEESYAELRFTSRKQVWLPPFRQTLPSTRAVESVFGEMLQLKKADPSAAVDAKKCRTHPRFSMTAIAEAVEIQTDTRIRGHISDIGEGGCYVEVMSPFGVGCDVNLRIVKNDKAFSAKGKVQYSKGGMGMGVAFTEIDPDQRPLLRQWIGELSGELTREPKVPQAGAEGHGNTTSIHEQRNVLNELIVTLMRKRVLTDAEGRDLLQKLLL
jgi:hypothetical protein